MIFCHEGTDYEVEFEAEFDHEIVMANVVSVHIDDKEIPEKDWGNLPIERWQECMEYDGEWTHDQQCNRMACMADDYRDALRDG